MVAEHHGGETAPSKSTVLDWVASGFSYANTLWQHAIKSDAVTWVMSVLPAKYGNHDLGAAMTNLQGFVADHPAIVWTAVAIIVVFGRRLLRRAVRAVVPIVA